MNRKILFGVFAVIFLIGFISAYTYSNPSTSLFNNAGGIGSFASYSSGSIDPELCSAGTDFILQINPFDCEPAPVRSDLLEEEDVTVYCKISATQINPLIDVNSIRTIYISGRYPSEIKSVGYFPSQSALGYTSENVLGDVALNDMGYVAITLRRNANESSMPDYVEGNLTARIKYDVENAFGVGNAEFSLPVLSDEEYNSKINQYSFWEGRGYLRVESVGNDNAVISIYSDVNSVGSSGVDKQRVSRVTLEKGETSSEIYIPGFSPCLASLKLRLNGFEDPDTTAKLKINSDYVEVADGNSFLDEKCHVTSIKKDGLNQRVSIRCKEDDDNSNFDLLVSPSVKLKVGDSDVKNYVVGDYLYTSTDNTKSVYLGYIGSKGDTEDTEDLYVVLIAIPESKSRLSESEISSIATRMNLLFSDVKTGAGILDVSASVLGKFAGGVITGLKWVVKGDDLHIVDLKSSSGVISAAEDFKGEKVSLAGFSEAQDSNFLSVEEESYNLKKVASDSNQNKYLILKDGEDTGLYLLESSSGSPRMILSTDSGTVLGRVTLGSFYGKDCESHDSCSQYLLSSNDLNSITSYAWFFDNLIYGEVNIDSGYILVKRVSFDAVSGEDYYEHYQNALSDFETILNSFSGEDYSSETTYGEEALYESILLSERLGQRKTMKGLCQDFEENYPDSDKPMDICEDVYRTSNTQISSREVLINGKIKEITFEGIYEPSYEEYGAEVLVRGPNGKVQTYQLRKDKTVYLTGLRGNSAEQETTVFTNNDDGNIIYYKYEDKWLWSFDKSNWRSDSPSAVSSLTISSENKNVIEKLKSYSYNEGETYLTSDSIGATTESVASTEFIRLSAVDEDSIRVYINTRAETGFDRLVTTNTYTLKEGESESFNSPYFFTLNDVNLEENAKVSIIPSFNYQESNTTFGFQIGIEKRAIQLSDDQIKRRIDSLNSSINDLEKLSDGLNTFNDALGKACLATGAVLTLKNFIANSDGKSIARQRVMQGSGGWNEFCQKEDSKDNSQYVSVDDCFFENSDAIDAQVDEVYNAIKGQDENINTIQSATPKTSLNTINEDEFMKKYSVQGVNSLNGIGDSNGEFVVEGKTEKLNIEKLQEDILDYDGWKAGNYNVDELREIELYANLVKTTTNSDNKKVYSQRLYSLLYDVSVNAETYVKQESLSDKYGMKVDLFEVGGKDIVKRDYFGGVYGNLPSEFRLKVSGYQSSDPVQVEYTSDGDEFVIFLEDKGESVLPVKRNEDGQKLIYDENGNLVSDKDLPTEFKKIYFKKYDAKSYENKYLNPEVKYYEEEPYNGYPAVVPLDTIKGWYAGVKPKLDVGSSIAAYDESGRVNSFWLCNVGENGLEEFSKDSFGDDICQQINVGVPGTVYSQFSGLSESETTKLVIEAVGTTGTQGAIEEAQRAYRNGAKRVRIGDKTYEVGEPAVESLAVSCTDYMSPTDCQVLFNVCDPVVCPSSRCDFGGNYPVKDVVQSGVIGSIALCAPNAREGIVVPVCTTGVQAGLDSWVSVEKAYRDCLQENLDTGATVGICDEIHSVYACEFFWRQGIPLAKVALPKALNLIAGEGVRGGGEYLGLQSSWDNARDSLDYFTQYYAAESYNAFKLRSVDEAGGAVCKNFASIVYPSGGELLDSLTTPRSPPQFSGNFDEIELTTITNPPTSHYKVYYRVYAGEDSGAYYQVYLTGGSTSSYYQDTSVRRVVASGYVVAGDTAVDTVDFTAPSGYVTMCVVVNGQEECDFKKVSTSFAVNYANDLYLAEQSTTTVTTEAECVSGTASLYSLLNPNAESIVDELIDPALYQKGIIRICATDNPGEGTDGAIGTEDQRWRDVGYCGDTGIRCWLDTDSVKNAIKALDIEKGVLNETAQSVVDSLVASGDYVDNQNYSTTISEINSESDSSKKIDLINGILDKVFFSSQKAELYFLRGLAYGALAMNEYAKVEKFQSDYFYNTAAALGEEDVRESYFVLGVGDEFSFDFGGKTYVVKVLEVDSKNLKAKVSIDAISKEQEFGLGDRVFFNLDSDSESDLALTLSDIEDGKAKFYMEIFYSVGEVELSSLDSLAQKIASYAGYFVNEIQACSVHTKDSGDPYYTRANCYNSITLVYDRIGVSRPNCIFSAQSGAELPSGIKVDDETDAFTHDCGTTGKLTEEQKLNLLAPGYQFDAIIPYNGDDHGSPNYAAHSLIFLSWKDKDKRIANVFDWNGDTYPVDGANTKGEKCEGEFIHTSSSGSQKCKTYRVYEMDLSDTDNYVYLIRGYSSDFTFGESKVSTTESKETSNEQDVSVVLQDGYEDSVSPTFKFSDGTIREDVYYKFFYGNWYWSYSKKVSASDWIWTSVDVSENRDGRNLIQRNANFAKTLEEKSYTQGLNLIFNRLDASDEGWFNADLRTDNVDVDDKLVFKVDDSFSGQPFYFKFENGDWFFNPTSLIDEDYWFDTSKTNFDKANKKISLEGSSKAVVGGEIPDKIINLVNSLADETYFIEGSVTIFKEYDEEDKSEFKKIYNSVFSKSLDSRIDTSIFTQGEIEAIKLADRCQDCEKFDSCRKELCYAIGIQLTDRDCEFQYDELLGQLPECVTSSSPVDYSQSFVDGGLRDSILETASALQKSGETCSNCINKVYNDLDIDIYTEKCVYISDNFQCYKCDYCSRDENDLKAGDLILVYTSSNEESFYMIFEKWSDKDSEIISGWVYDNSKKVLIYKDVSLAKRNAVSVIFDPTKGAEGPSSSAEIEVTSLCNLDVSKSEYDSLVKFLGNNGLTVAGLNCNFVFVENKHLVQLYVPQKEISNLNGLDGLVYLEDLRLSDNEISDVTPLNRLTTLRVLYLNNNNLVNILSLGGLKNLESLHLEQNKIDDISALENLGSLTFLNVQSNCLPGDYDFSYFEKKDDLTFSKTFNPKSSC